MTRPITLVMPPGRNVKGTSEPIIPLITSLAVPSPPNEQTTSYVLRPSASATISVAWLRSRVSITSIS